MSVPTGNKSPKPGCTRQPAQSSAVPSAPAVETSCKSLDLLGLLYPCMSSCSCHKSGEEGLEGPLNRPPASSRRKRPSTWNCLLCGLPARSPAAASPSITCGGHGRSHHRLTRASGKWETRGMQEHCNTGSGLRVSCPLPPVVGAIAFRYTEAAVPQSSTQLTRLGIILPTCCPTAAGGEVRPPLRPTLSLGGCGGVQYFPFI